MNQINLNKKIFLVASLILFFYLSPLKVIADTSCSLQYLPGAALPVSVCTSGIKTTDFNFKTGDQPDLQQENEWCWAASIELIFKYYGIDFTQTQIVQTVFGGVVNSSATDQQVFEILNGKQYVDNQGITFTVKATDMRNDPLGVIEELNENHPLLIGVNEAHAMVNTAATYVCVPFHPETLQFTTATVRDPWPYNQSIRFLTPQEFSNVSLLLKVTVTKEPN